MVVFALFIISKSGGLIYNREFHTGMAKLTSNDYLMLAGSFHGMHAITAQLSPVPPARAPPPSTTTPNLQTFPVRATGIEVLESSHFRIQCFQTQTGVKFLLFTEPQQPNVDTMIKKIYELYADYVMKNPFYTVEMPIRCDKFDRGLDGFVKIRGVRTVHLYKNTQIVEQATGDRVLPPSACMAAQETPSPHARLACVLCVRRRVDHGKCYGLQSSILEAVRLSMSPTSAADVDVVDASLGWGQSCREKRTGR